MSADKVLHQMAETFEKRNVVYKDNYKNVGDAMVALFPNGVTLKTADDFNRWHLLELAIVKIARFCNSGMLHKDSVHDAAVYMAMVEDLTTEDSEPLGG